jgi:archaellum component FlaC/ABC-type cobalamin/Fe3+-siderophores transport system ATPase subunit
MRLKRIVLDGYRFLALSGHQHLDWRPDASYQMILGTNGCGKSSLMGECSPLPPVPSDYTKPGRKYVEYVHEDAEYVLTSDIGTSVVRHSFVRDGIELNEGGTSQVQKELVLRYFRYTQELHDLITGRIRFTTMTQAERRKWVTRLSQVDYTFALRVYERLREQSTAMKGFLKLTKQRLAEEVQTLSRMEEAQGIEERVKTLQSELQALLMARYPVEVSSYEALGQLRQSQTRLEEAGENFLRGFRGVDLKRKDRNIEGMEQSVQTLQQDIRLHTSILERLQKEYSDVDNQLIPLRQEEFQTPEAMQQRVAELEQHATNALAKISQWGGVLVLNDDPEATLRASETAIPSILQIFSALPDNSQRKYTREKMEFYTNRRREASDKLSHSEGGQRIVLQRLHALEHAKQETCPECKHSWVPGINPAEIPELNAKLAAFVANINECKAAFEEAEKYLSEMEEYMSVYRQWRGMVQQYPRLKPLWDHIQDNRFDLNEPSSHRAVFLDWLEEARYAAKYHQVMQDIEKLKKLIEIATLGEGALLAQRLTALEAEISKHTETLAALRNQYGRESIQLNLFRALKENEQYWLQAFENLSNAYTTALESIGAEHIESDIQLTQTQLGALQHTLRTKEIAQGVILDLQRSVERAEIDNEALLLLTEELSPKEGLIAEQLHGFIKCLTAQINSIISSVWTYELEVLPCGMGEGELDYLFPLQSGPTGLPAKDVKHGSRSQAEIVDFAFAQTAMLYLDLGDYPLFVDELGASFDEAHRPQVNQFVSRLMESGRYSQVFMISHYVAGWGSFTDAEYLVLDSRNITVPSQHNTHVVLS